MSDEYAAEILGATRLGARPRARAREHAARPLARHFWGGAGACAVLAARAQRSLVSRSSAEVDGAEACAPEKLASGHFGYFSGSFRAQDLGMPRKSGELASGETFYGYCRGDPIGGSDPSGLAPKPPQVISADEADFLRLHDLGSPWGAGPLTAEQSDTLKMALTEGKGHGPTFHIDPKTLPASDVATLPGRTQKNSAAMNEALHGDFSSPDPEVRHRQVPGGATPTPIDFPDMLPRGKTWSGVEDPANGWSYSAKTNDAPRVQTLGTLVLMFGPMAVAKLAGIGEGTAIAGMEAGAAADEAGAGSKAPGSGVPEQTPARPAATTTPPAAPGRIEQFRTLAPGFDVGETRFTINEHVINSLQKSGRRSIDTQSMIRALGTEPTPGTPGSSVFTDPSTGAKFFVNEANQVVGVHPEGFR